jgi:hypothetical protein
MGACLSGPPFAVKKPRCRAHVFVGRPSIANQDLTMQPTVPQYGSHFACFAPCFACLHEVRS